MAGMTLGRAWRQMSWFYYQYLLVTALYMLEPWERTVFKFVSFVNLMELRASEATTAIAVATASKGHALWARLMSQTSHT